MYNWDDRFREAALLSKKTITVTCLVAIISATMLIGTGAYAITGNYQPSTERSCVGLVVFYTTNDAGVQTPAQVCSGILIGPNIMLTAAHACVSETVAVVFDVGPITWQQVGDELQLKGVTNIYFGKAVANPAFSMGQQGNGAPNFMTHVLDEEIPTTVVSQYGELPDVGLVDSLSVNAAVELVGYGMQEHLTPRNTGIANTWTGIIMRTSATSRIISASFAWSHEFIRCSANLGGGKGGISYGDSGGPVFLAGTNTVLALNSYVSNPNCVGQTYHTRLDIADIHNWIQEEVNVYG
jgi:hypothetical protein